MFLSIYDNRNGEEYLRRLSPTETIDLREHVERWAAAMDCVPSFSEPGSHIPNGCGDYQAEIRDTKAPTGSCWAAEPFFLQYEGE